MSETAQRAERRFTTNDQQAFAALSGDANPMHMDAQAARRTPAGACVVHGVQSMLWALEELATALPLHSLRALDADFAQFLYLGEPASLHLVKSGPSEARIELRVGETRISQYVLGFGEIGEAPEGFDARADEPIVYAASRTDPLPLDWDAVARARGTVACGRDAAGMAGVYPRLVAALGAERVASLMSLTRLVGMVSPGLHSTFHRINVKIVAAPEARGELAFSTIKSDPRFAVVTIAVRADGIAGTLKASRRQPPTLQPGSEALRGMIECGRFAGHAALVVGGSRGLGEVTAKLLGLGGARVIITYASGEAEAAAVAADIIAAGGTARTMRLDVLAPLAAQLADLGDAPSSVYYFATTRISGRSTAGFSSALFHGFCRVYVDAFHDLCAALSRAPLQAFYPSSVFVSEPARSMAEYAAAKAAGEVLAADITRFMPRVAVESVRLPRVATDQTAGMIEVEMGSAVDSMLPIVLRIEDRVASVPA